MCPIFLIVLTDDHPVILMRLAATAGQFPRQQVVAQAYNGRELMQVLAHIDCNVIVAGHNLGSEPVLDGMQLLAHLHQRHPRCGIVVCAMVCNPALLRAMRQIGVTCIISKNDDFVHAGHAVMAAAHDMRYDSPRTLEELGLNSNGRDGFERLGARKREVLHLYAADMAVSDIAQILDPSVKTVSTQRAMALRKLGLVREISPFQYTRVNRLTTPR